MKSELEWLREAIEISKKCPKSEKSFAVGAVIVAPSGELISTGYSLELGDSTHAEQNAIEKAKSQGLSLAESTIYCSLEPCSIRLSGKLPCCNRILESKIKKVVFALKEPPIFVKCEGQNFLSSAGLEVLHLSELGSLVQEINSHVIRE